MKFETFVELLPKIEKIKVNSAQAQLELAPENRTQFQQDYKNERTRHAGVMAIISPVNGDACITFIVRAEGKGKHSGQIAFPGGKWEKSDKTYLATAFREVEEEIGVPEEELRFIRDLFTIYVPVSEFRVYPFLAFADKELEYIAQETEVAKIIQMPLATLLSRETLKTIPVQVSKHLEINAPAFVFEGYSIWGATSMVLNELKKIIVKSMDI